MKQDAEFFWGGGAGFFSGGKGVAVVLVISHFHCFGAAFEVTDVCLNSSAFFLH